MEKYVEKAPMGLLCLFSAKLLFLHASWEDICLMAILAAVGCFLKQHQKSKEKDEFNKKFEELATSIAKAQKDAEDAKTSVASIKMGQAMRAANVRG